MSELYQCFPFVAAFALLFVGVLRMRKFLFVSSFIVLLGACFYDLAADGSSGAFAIIGASLLLFGFFCVILSFRLPARRFISAGTMRAIGALFIVLGFAGAMII